MTLPLLAPLLRGLAHKKNLACFDLGAGQTMVTWGDGPAVTAGDDWQEQARALLRPGGGGGLVGWLGYESGRLMERMPHQPLPRRVADLCLWRVEGAVRLARGRWCVSGSAAFRQEAEQLLQQLPPVREPPRTPQAWSGSPDAQQRYEAGVRRILRAITAGEVYQTSLAWEQTGIPTPDPLGSWLALRRHNPATWGAYLRRGSVEILSNSPELYLHIHHQGPALWARSVPIKGTASLAEGDAGRLRLWQSDKERAELTMIVDLVRNDLGRVAAPGTVRAGPRRLRRCGDLLHAEQDISARLAEGIDALDAVAASFPPGSVTGAPKVAAMKLIGELEAGPRGVYTGAIGSFDDDGDAHLSVAIRTATVCEGLAHFHVGAGIVADSDPHREWRETLAKGAALAGWLGPGT